MPGSPATRPEIGGIGGLRCSTGVGDGDCVESIWFRHSSTEVLGAVRPCRDAETTYSVLCRMRDVKLQEEVKQNSVPAAAAARVPV